MPKYFFDCFDGRQFQPDHHGVDLADPDEVAVHGACLVRELLTEASDSVGVRGVAVMVRSTDGAQVYVAHCNFQAVSVPGRDQRDRN